jgi:hypothetical protein
MVKKVKSKISTNGARGELELRRWCIERAIAWPEDRFGIAGAQQQLYQQRTETDVIGRASKILAWVKAH